MEINQEIISCLALNTDVRLIRLFLKMNLKNNRKAELINSLINFYVFYLYKCLAMQVEIKGKRKK